jgi:hypothetical protein
MAEVEGVIKYQLSYTPAPAQSQTSLAELIAWQQILHRLELLGRDPARYSGLAYGNLSQRLPQGGFVISASQTGDKATPTADDYAWVSAWDCAHNQVVASGPAKPSSESLTHAALYDASPDISCVLHVHSPLIWQRRAQLGLMDTAAEVAYGTPAMAAAATQLCREQAATHHGVFAMGGHLDGVLSYGPTPDSAGWELLLTLRRALTVC